MGALLSTQASAMRRSAAGRAASSSKRPATTTTREDSSLVLLLGLSFSHLFRASRSQAFARLVSHESCQSCSASCRCLSTTASVIFLLCSAVLATGCSKIALWDAYFLLPTAAWEQGGGTCAATPSSEDSVEERRANPSVPECLWGYMTVSCLWPSS